jgi:hypothetical protein
MVFCHMDPYAGQYCSFERCKKKLHDFFLILSLQIINYVGDSDLNVYILSRFLSNKITTVFTFYWASEKN